MNNDLYFTAPQPAPVRFAAKLISYIFHPLFIPGFICTYLIYVHPYAFAGLTDKGRLMKFVSLFLITGLFPAFTVFLLWRLDFANSIFLRTPKERIIPYMSCTIYYFWAWYVTRSQEGNPPVLVFFLLGLFITTSIAVIVNNYFKISMHAMGVGGGAAFMILMGLSDTTYMAMPITIATLIGGLVCTSRFIVSNHKPGDVYSGLFLAAFCQLVAWWVVM
jgi:hypothetical protein